MRKFNSACALFAAFIDSWFPATIPTGFVALLPVGIYVAGRMIMGHFIEYFKHFAYWDAILGGVILLLIAAYLNGHRINRDAVVRWDRAKKNNHPSIPTKRPPIP